MIHMRKVDVPVTTTAVSLIRIVRRSSIVFLLPVPFVGVK
jgi:hypothetical protein